MKKYLLFTAVSVCSSLVQAQIRCEDVKCITEEQIRYGENEAMEELTMFEDFSNPIPIVVFDSSGYESEQMTYQVVPLTGCMKSCDEKYLIQISYYENGKQQGPSLSYGQDGEVTSKGHYFNNNKIGEHVKYGKNREIVQRVNYDQFGKKHGEEMIVRGDSIELIVNDHGKAVSSVSKKVKKKK
jgi:antitoxin component YwqK of YwqJK toxin-antitoxin module